MMQIVPEYREPSLGERFGQAFSNVGQAAAQAIPEYMMAKERKKIEKEQYEKENQAAKRFGIDISDIRDPKIRQKAVELALQGKNKRDELDFRNQQRQKMLAEIEGQGNQREAEFFDQGQLETAIPHIEQQLGFKLTPEQKQSIAQQLQSGQGPYQERNSFKMEEDPFLKAKKYASIGEPGLASIAAKETELLERSKEKSPEFQREQQITKSQAQADVKYNEQLQEASKQHELKEQTLNRLEKLNKKGVTGKPWEKAAEKVGLVNITSSGRREFAADVKNLITDIRSILGAQFTGFEFQTILNAYPSADFSEEANASIIKNLKDFQDIKRKEVEFANQLKKENKGKIPYDFQSKVNEKVRDYAMTKIATIKDNTRKIMNEQYGIQPGFVLMFDPNDEPLNVPESEIEKYESLGARL